MACTQLVSIDMHYSNLRQKHGWKGLAGRLNHVDDVNVYLGRQREESQLKGCILCSG